MINEIKIVNLPKISDPRGNLTFIQAPDHIPFHIKRAFWMYDVPGGEIRGGHAYKSQHEVIIALSGSFDVIITDRNNNRRIFHLNRSYFGLYLPPDTWRHMENFSTNSISLHLSSEIYNEDDYIRDFNEYNSVK